MNKLMRGASAESLETLAESLGAAVSGGADGTTVGEELFSVASLLHSEAGLRRVLTDLSKAPEAKSELARGLLAGKVSQPTLDLVATAASLRWAGTRDLPEALEQLGVGAIVRGAEASGQADRLEDELFGVTRLVAENPGLRDALADPNRSTADKRGLLHQLLGDKVTGATLHLVDQALGGSHRSVQVAIEQYQKVAAAHRDRLVAEVRVARPLGDDDRRRLEAALSAQYGRQVKLNTIVDPDVIGGLRVAVGDDVIDGTVASRLDDARRKLAG